MTRWLRALPAALLMRLPAPALAQAVLGSGSSAWAGGAPAIRATITGLKHRSNPLKLAAAVIDVGRGVASTTIAAQCLRGLSGFGPVGH